MQFRAVITMVLAMGVVACGAGQAWVASHHAGVCMDTTVCGPVVAAPPPRSAARPQGMLLVPAGMFWMGSPDGEGADDQYPQHRASVAAFCMDRTEVTVDAYSSCVRTGGCRPAPTTVNYATTDHQLLDPWCNGARSDRGSHPINCVDWQMATDFCTAQGNRLPTEAEWEYGARGSDGRTYPWGNQAPAPDLLNACGSECAALGRANGRSWNTMYPGDDGWASTSPVGSTPAGRSPFGLDDMAGGVWEWTSDWYGPSTAEGPAGSGRFRVYRGGSWISYNPLWVRAAFRYRGAPSFRDFDLGFRCARGAS